MRSRGEGGSHFTDVSSGDDTDYEVEDQFKDLHPKILDVHLNSSALTGESVISSTSSINDVVILENSSNKRELNDSGYDSNKYFRKKRKLEISDVSRKNPETSVPIVLKDEPISISIKHENCASDSLISDNASSDAAFNHPDVKQENSFTINESLVDVKLEVKEGSVDGLGVGGGVMSDADELLSLKAGLGPRECEALLKLEGIRHWEETGLGQAIGRGERTLHQSDITFRLASYNILSQDNLERHSNLYRNKDSYLLQWDYRWSGLKREFLVHDPDIIALQEVQFDNPDYFSSHLKPWFDRRGFDVISKRRTGEKNDGCAIFYRREKFSLVKSRSVEFNRPGVPTLCKDNVGIVAALQASNGSVMVVGTVHHLFNPKRHDLRLCQVALMLGELDRVAWSQQSRSYLPAILCGDFNLQPYSDSYSLLRRGMLEYQGIVCGRASLPRSLFPESLGFSDSCQWEEELTMRGKRPQYGSGRFYHSFGLRTVYKHSRHQDTRVPVGGYEATTFHGSWVTVDYIFYSTVEAEQDPNSPSDGRREGKLKLRARMALPTGPEISALGGLPSEIFPSDHLPLLAEFILKK